MTDAQLRETLILILRALERLMREIGRYDSDRKLIGQLAATVKELKRLPEIAVGCDEVDDGEAKTDRS